MGDDELGERLTWAAANALRPFVKRLLAAGVPFGRLESRLREIFVEIAGTDLALPGRRQTDSRVSLLTGINRKEVRRIRAAAPPPSGRRSFSMNHAASLVSRWLADARTTDRRGRPRALPYQASRGPSFMKLARAVTADLAPRVLLDELVRNGAVEVGADGQIALSASAYVPQRDRAEKLQILGEDPPELIETILRNVFAETSELLLQRKVYYDNVGSEAAPRLRAEVRREGERFLREVNRLLARYDRDRTPTAPGGERLYAGVGVYFFEAPVRPEAAKATRRQAATRQAKERKR